MAMAETVAVSRGSWPALQRAIEATSAPMEQPPSLWQRVRRGLVPGGSSSSKKVAYPNGVYILVYHSVVDPNDRQPWEQCYRKGEVLVEQFRCQIEYMLTHMTPIALSQLSSGLVQGGLDRPYVAITFDDGFRNNLTVADSVLQEYNLKPTVFVSGAFANGQEVFFRVLSAVLIARGHAAALADRLRSLTGGYDWSHDGLILFGQMKQNYVADVIEQATAEVYRHHLGDPLQLAVHLQVDEIRQLYASGWEIANHTEAHRLLSHQSATAAVQSIENNARFWQHQGINLINFLAFPVGRAQDVNQAVSEWLDKTPEINGVFSNDGVNFSYRRKEWLRFSLGSQTRPEVMDRMIRQQIARTKQANLLLQHERWVG